MTLEGTVTRRLDGRRPDQLRPVRITPGYLLHAEGSALIEAGNNRVICAVTVEERVPPFLRGTGKGWVTAEYGMLPRSTPSRTPREGADRQARGRAMEIQRIVARSLRAVVNREALGDRTFIVDCDVLQADGGTRTLAISGAYVALSHAFHQLARRKLLKGMPFRCAVAAVSVGVVDGAPLLDLSYQEDARADVDFNVVMTDRGELVEVQGTAEGNPFTRTTMDALLTLAEGGIRELFAVQQEAMKELTGKS
jgi:ribonuclease PH